MTEYFNQFRNGFQGELPKAPIDFANLEHSSDPRERMIFRNSVYTYDNWLRLIDALNTVINADLKDIEAIDWQTTILDAISDLNCISQQDTRPTVKNVIVSLRANPEISNLFGNTEESEQAYEQDLKAQLLNEFLPTFINFLEQGYITDMDLGKYSERLRNPKDVHMLSALKNRVKQLEEQFVQSQQVPPVRPIEHIEHGGFITEDEARELGYCNYIYVVKGRNGVCN